MTLGSSPMPPSELQTPLLAPSLVPVASPRLLSQEAWVSLGAGLPLGEACRLGALQTDGYSGRIEEGLGAPACTCASPGRRERLRGGVQEEGAGRGAPQPRPRAPWSAAVELQLPTGS